MLPPIYTSRKIVRLYDKDRAYITKIGGKVLLVDLMLDIQNGNFLPTQMSRDIPNLCSIISVCLKLLCNYITFSTRPTSNKVDIFHPKKQIQNHPPNSLAKQMLP